MKTLLKTLAVVVFGVLVFLISRHTAEVACYSPDFYLGNNAAVGIKHANYTDILCVVKGTYREYHFAGSMSK